ncbi:MAG TPA: peptidoglycan DD-metalloendopeptidase family protein [Burkholderiaceae bacterium]|nr:peptidoglycan DD-metalloendopeptidase family protein [Burkholderiaceae bacterium]
MDNDRMVRRTIALLLGAWLAAGCTSTPNRAPVEDRGAGSKPVAAAAPAASAASAPADAGTTLPGAENNGKPGYYTVKPGDTLIRIGLENGQNWKDLVKWNNIDNPNIIEVGQVFRVLPPGVDPASAASKPVTTARVETKPLDPKAAATGASAPPPSAAAPPAAPRDGDDDVNWAWPAAGPVVAPFEDGKVKGLVIGGKAGDPIYAAADGRVVYAGSGLRGYGNLVILKHNNTYLTAYAHNQALLVKEDQSVRRGQKIAEMGSTDADGVKLHFEIRRQGKPIDPAKLLPAR